METSVHPPALHRQRPTSQPTRPVRQTYPLIPFSVWHAKYVAMNQNTANLSICSPKVYPELRVTYQEGWGTDLHEVPSHHQTPTITTTTNNNNNNNNSPNSTSSTTLLPLLGWKPWQPNSTYFHLADTWPEALEPDVRAHLHTPLSDNSASAPSSSSSSSPKTTTTTTTTTTLPMLYSQSTALATHTHHPSRDTHPLPATVASHNRPAVHARSMPHAGANINNMNSSNSSFPWHLPSFQEPVDTGLVPTACTSPESSTRMPPPPPPPPPSSPATQGVFTSSLVTQPQVSPWHLPSGHDERDAAAAPWHLSEFQNSLDMVSYPTNSETSSSSSSANANANAEKVANKVLQATTATHTPSHTLLAVQFPVSQALGTLGTQDIPISKLPNSIFAQLASSCPSPPASTNW